MTTNEKELENVKKLLDLEKYCTSEENKFRYYNNAKFEEQPKRPTRKVVEKIIPDIPENPLKTNKIIAVGPFVFFLILLFIVTPFTHGNHIVANFILLILSFFWMIGYAVFAVWQDHDYRKRYRKSSEWTQRCNESNIENAKQQKEADEAYRRAVYKYENEILPDWKERYIKWQDRNEKAMSASASKLAVLQRNLEGAYRCFPQIPIEYRNLSAIQFIYDTMSFSGCSLQYAIDSYTEKLENDAEARRQAEIKRQEDEERYEARRERREVRDEFLGRAAATAAGVYVGNKMSKRSEEKKSSKNK